MAKSPFHRRSTTALSAKKKGSESMSTTIYMFDCMSFGVRAYLHFMNLANRREYLQSILNGKTLVE